jgi:hypothetical protein
MPRNIGIARPGHVPKARREPKSSRLHDRLCPRGKVKDGAIILVRDQHSRPIPLAITLHCEPKTVSFRQSFRDNEPLRHALRRRPFFAGILLVVFLTVQLAAAAYACAGNQYRVGSGDMKAALTESCADMANGADADSRKDEDNGALCLAHCQADSKSADHVAPQLPVFLPVLTGVIEPAPVAFANIRTVLRTQVAARAPPPPLAVLYCSFQT